jgi:AraC-like DNA-binding protein
MKVQLEQVSHREQSFRVLQLELRAFEGAWHRHPQAELTWIESGQGLRFIGDDVAPFADDDLVLLGPNLPHVWLSPPEREGQAHRTTVLQFRSDLFAVNSVPEWLAVQALLARAATGLAISGPCKAQVIDVLRRIPAASDLVRLSLLLEVLGLLTQNPQALKAIASSQSKGALGTDQRIEALIPWIQNELHRPLGIAEASKRVHISPAAFSRFFRKNMGKAFTVYVNDMRCAEACVQLQSTKRSIAQIAEACGFQTLSHFNRQFRRRHGLTPRELRARL